MKRRLHYMATRGDSQQLLERAASSGVDAMMFDLEDGVPEHSKESARETLRTALRDLDWGEKFKMVRINELTSPHFRSDLSLVDAGPDALLLPKVESADEVRQADRMLAAAEAEAGVEVGRTKLYVMLERGRAVLQAYDILTASPRMEGAIFGHIDFTVDVGFDGIAADGFRLNPEVIDIAHALIVMAAHAAKVQLVGAPSAPLRDEQAQVDGMRRLFALGYDGILILTPRHIEWIDRARKPEPAVEEFARGVIDAFEQGLREKNTTVSTYKDWVVEAPFVAMARRVLARGE